MAAGCVTMGVGVGGLVISHEYDEEQYSIKPSPEEDLKESWTIYDWIG